MKTLLLVIGFFFYGNLCAQSERADIISKRIKSVTTSYWAPDSSKKIETTKYYTVRGDDSLEYYCGEISFSFKTIMANNGKVERVERYDVANKLDELHMYKYGNNGAYSIEIVAHGAGTILFSKYDVYNNCLEQVFSGVETLHYEYDSLNKLKRILYNNKDEKPIPVATVVYNSKGVIEKIVGAGASSPVQYFKYNDFGLVSERTVIGLDENGNEKKQTVFYEYAFWQ